jgi:tight adherence protein B
MTEQLMSFAIPALAAAATLLAWSGVLLWGSAFRGRAESARPAQRNSRARATPPSRVPMAIGLALAGALWIGLDQPLLAAGAMAVWMGAISLLRTRRERQVEERELQFAIDAIGSAGRALRSGIPMTGVLGILAEEGRGQTQLAFREIVSREALGEDLASSVRAVLLPSRIPALRSFGLALIQQISAGGNLSDVTDRLAMSLVERARVRRRIRTILAYGRSAAIVLSITPLIAVPVLCQLVEGYSNLLFDSAKGQVLLVMAALMIVVGGVSIQRMTGIDTSASSRGVS